MSAGPDATPAIGPTIHIDADACPVKDETYRVAERYRLPVRVVCNRPIRVPLGERVRLVVVGDAPDAADDWIVGHACARDVVITSDLPLAKRCIDLGARVLRPTGHELTEEAINDALATRDLLEHLRQAGEATGGPAPMDRHSRSRFLSRLDEIVVAQLRQR